MEFERSIFRMHERLLLTRSCPKIVTIVQRLSCAIFAYLLVSFVIYHKLYVNQSSILQSAIEDQLLARYNDPIYQHLSYSASSDRFIFCNKVTLQRDDTVSLVKYAIQRTN